MDPASVPEEYQFYLQGEARQMVSQDPQQQEPPTPELPLAGGGSGVGDPEACIRVNEDFESMGMDEIMPIFQASHQEVMNSIRLFGKYVILHF